MKAPPKRKGNVSTSLEVMSTSFASMKAPPKRKGNCGLGESSFETAVPQ